MLVYFTASRLVRIKMEVNLLEILERYHDKNKHGHTLTLYRCSYCGNNVVRCYAARNMQSCGCMQYELIAQSVRTNQDRGAKEYICYHHIKGKCYNPKNSDYKYYGGRGIIMSDRWLESYENFLEDMGRSPSKEYTLERKDVDGNYCKENCCWASRQVQASNRRKKEGTSSDYIGVNYHKVTGKYYARVAYNGEEVFRELFNCPLEAAKARDEFVKAHNLPHKLNFD